jgi:hypothetical protein
MTETEKELWKRINEFEIDEPDASFSFSARLARENNWPLDFALRTIHEYKKFMFLLCVQPQPLTPSEEVDQVWHLHLIYTKSYWDLFCDKVLQRKIHHNPTQGGAGEEEKFYNWYDETLAIYKQYFDKKPPTDIWPPAEIRFKEIVFTRINRHRYWLLPKLNVFKK